MSSEIRNQEFAEWRELVKSHFSPVNMMADSIKYPVTTEKSYLAMFKNKQYTFDVDPRLTKPQIKKLFETIEVIFCSKEIRTIRTFHHFKSKT